MSNKSSQNSPTVLLVRNAARGDFGGAERYPVSLANLIQKEGSYTPIIVTRSQKLLEYAESNTVSTIRGWWLGWQNWSGIRTLLFPFYIVWQLTLTVWYISLLLRTQASAIHLQSRDDFIAGTLAAKLLKRTSVWTDHMDLRYIFQNIAKPFKNPVGKLVFWSAKRADHIIIISDNEYRLITAHCKNPHALDTQITVIKNGVVDTRDQLTRQPSPKNEVHLCLASRMVKNKGVGDAIQAFLSLDNPHAYLDIYGDGPDSDTFRRLAAGNSHIRFYGHTDNPLQAIYNSDVFILPSYQEGLSIALLEATMLGATIIASDVDSNPEVIDDKSNGLLVPPRQPNKLADAMQALIESPQLRARYGSAARTTYEQTFNLETIVRTKILPLYKTRARQEDL